MALALGLSACATLPDVDRQLKETPQAQISVSGASAPASAKRVEALLDGLDDASEARLRRHLAFEEKASGGRPLVAGNRVTLLRDGPETYAAMFEAIRGARDHIHLETFVFDDGEVGQRFSQLLQERAKQGVHVRLIYDAIGTIQTPRAFFEKMEAAGVERLEFHPVNPIVRNAKPWLLNNRDHRKLLVVDGRTAFIGGINISETYTTSSGSGSLSGSSSGDEDGDEKEKDPVKHGWRDSHLRIEGPAVAEFQRLFVETWNSERKDRLADTGLYPKLDRSGDAVVRAIATTFEDEQSAIFSTLISALKHAHSSAYLTIAYFAPDEQLLEALEDCAKRGVDVRLILPSQTDSWSVFHVGRSHYSRLLKAGVRIYERQGTVIHAKTVTIDGVWSTIGSSNFDWRSFLHNNEANAVVLGRQFGSEMTAMFRDDIGASREVTLDQWRHRPWLTRAKEWSARLGAYFL